MLVEINLLPQKEPKKFSFIIILSCLLVVIVIIAGFYLWQTQSIKDELASLDRQISMTKKITEKEEQKSKKVESTGSVGQLKSAIEWAEKYPIQTIPVMRHLTSLLPERGFIQSFGYTEEGTITLTVQFDSAREAAYFLEHLNQSKWIEDASLSSLSAAADPTETTSDGSTTGSTTNTTNETNTTNQNQSTTGQDPNGTTADAGNQTNTAAGTTANRNNNTTTDPNAGNNPSNAATISSTIVSENANILPRYTGQFEIKLNKEFVKENIKKSKKDEKEVAGS